MYPLRKYYMRESLNYEIRRKGDGIMSRDWSNHSRNRWLSDGVITAIAFGGFLVIVGVLFAVTPNLWQAVVDFFDNITTRTVPYSGAGNFVLPAPRNPAAHSTLYNALFQFDLAFGALQVFILILRIGARSKVRRIAETFGNVVFWFGAAFLVNSLLLVGTLTSWFEYWAALVIVVGISIVARGVIHLIKR